MTGRTCEEPKCFGSIDAVLSPALPGFCDVHLDAHRLDDADMWLLAASKKRSELKHARQEAAFTARVDAARHGQLS